MTSGGCQAGLSQPAMVSVGCVNTQAARQPPFRLSFLWHQGQGAAFQSHHRSEETAQGRNAASPCQGSSRGGWLLQAPCRSLSWAVAGLAVGQEWLDCPSLALRWPWGVGRRRRLPLGNATSLERPTKVGLMLKTWKLRIYTLLLLTVGAGLGRSA